MTPPSNTGVNKRDSVTIAGVEVPERIRVSVELSQSVALLLDHIGDVTGASRSQVITSALLAALPDLVANADALKVRSGQLLKKGGK